MKLAAILNLTPDSFSDGGKYISKESIIARVVSLIEEGADIIDIGAESTRPGAIPLSAKQEWERLSPYLSEIINICKKRNIITSLDSYHPENVKKAIELGIDWINDVTGLDNPDMVDVLKDNDVKIVIMHNLGVPADKSNVISEDKDPIDVILNWTQNKLKELHKSNISSSRLILDPGIGFGKNAKQSLEILDNAEKLLLAGLPVFIGHSRKSFLFSNAENISIAQRDAKTIDISLRLYAKNIDYLRVHDIAGHRKALNR
ncbi:dihydropteroate synthase [Rickettsiales bacterium]|nr:dihydropteroate synthase [Rickettsiales bacterium]